MAQHRFLVPTVTSAAYRIGAYIHKHGPVDMREIRQLMPKSKDPAIIATIETWIARGWLYAEPGGKTVLTQRAKNFFDSATPDDRMEVGKVATPCLIDVMSRPPYKPAPRFVRQDVPEWSKRPEGFSFKTALGAREVSQ